MGAILANPRYTGRQVWNRQRTDCERTQDELPGLLQVRRLTAGTQWAISTKPTHPGLVSVHDFIAAQAVSALPQARDGNRRTYLLVGVVRCGLCGRSMESRWSHGNPCYRCRHGHTTAHKPTERQANNLYLREGVILARALAQLPQIGSRDPHIQRHRAYVQDSNKPAELVRFLRANQITIICNRDGICLETETAGITINRDTRSTPTTTEIPRQRSSTTRAPRDDR